MIFLFTCGINGCYVSMVPENCEKGKSRKFVKVMYLVGLAYSEVAGFKLFLKIE